MTHMTIVRVTDIIVPEENPYRKEYGENVTIMQDVRRM